MATVLAVRLLPVAPFTVVNLVAGASRIRFRDFILGSILGMTPGLLGISLFSDRVLAVLRNPSPLTLALLLVAIAAIALGAYLLKRWFTRRKSTPGPAAEGAVR